MEKKYVFTFIVPVLLFVSQKSIAQTPTTTQNFIMETSVKVAGLTTEASLTGLPVTSVNRSVNYFDGLGRMIQSVVWKGSNDQHDLVNVTTYDDLGRSNLHYLPFCATTADAGFKVAAEAAALAYYSTSPTGVVQTLYPFSKPVYEPSPMNRIMEQGACGAPWQPLSSSIAGSGHTQKVDYKLNNAADTVKLWTITGATVSTVASYGAGELMKTLSKDENWISGNAGVIEEYKDMEGKIVCKRVWESAVVARSTHYVYDEYNRLRYVIPPKVTALSLTEGSTLEFDQLVYAYHYDGLGRIIEKKIPGKGWEEMVYDKLDRLVMSRDAIQAVAGKWLFSKYDTFSRPIITGVISSSSTRAAWQASFTATTKICEGRDNTNISGTGTGYTNVALPAHNLVSSYYTLNYYDDYSFYGNTFGNPTGTQSTAVKSLLTGSKVNILGTATMLLTTNYYDAKGRLVQSRAQNHLNGVDATDLVYNFQDQVISNTRTHAIGSTSTMIYLTYEYDHMGRKIKTYEKIGNASSAQVLLSELTYNGIGQLTAKKRNNGLNTNTFSYNERGWLTGSAAPGFLLAFNYTDGTYPQYNGNIANQQWSTAGGPAKTYIYAYDKLNRLTSGVSTDGKNEQGISYDPMGNMMTLTRDALSPQVYAYTGNKLNAITGGLIRSYTYDLNGNALADGVNTFTYNVLNLPATITGANAATYTYDATGKKLTRVKGSVTTHYVNGIQYTGSAIDFIQTEEGIARPVSGAYTYEYTLKDHLGNARYSFNSAGTKIQSDDYYPFGKAFNSYVLGARNNYLYNGKELQDGLEQYDYGARFYDPAVGRWSVVDLKSEKYLSVSPYVYAIDCPIKFIDPDGREIKPTGTDAEILRINNALKIIEKTNPEIYKTLKEAKEIFTISIAQMVPKKSVDISTGSHSTVSFESRETTADQNGEFSTEFSIRDRLNDINPAFYEYSFTRQSPGSDPESISESQANDLVGLIQPSITIDEGLSGKGFARVLAHEFGHGAYTLLNKAKAAFTPGDDKKGHATGNKNGEAAEAADKQFDESYKEALKKLKEEEEKRKKGLN